MQAELEALLTDMYLCDFSVFHSMLDHWAIKQLFPIMPLQRLDERPERRAVVVDLTCDSDGKVSEYVSSLEDRSHLPLHVLKKGEPYYLGIFLVGAYQDILGDAHNLFGRLPEVHVYADDEEDGNFWIEKVIPGMSVHEMLAQVQYFPERPEPADERTGATQDRHRRSASQCRHAHPQRVPEALQRDDVLRDRHCRSVNHSHR